MKKLLFLLALAAGAATAHAQTQPATDASGVPLINHSLPPAGTAAPVAATPRRQPASPDQLAARQSQRLTRELGLAAEQQSQVQQILLGQYQTAAAARQQAQASGRRGTGRTLQASRAQADAQLRQVLSADQYARYQQLLTQRRQQARQRRQQAADGGNLLGD